MLMYYSLLKICVQDVLLKSVLDSVICIEEQPSYVSVTDSSCPLYVWTVSLWMSHEMTVYVPLQAVYMFDR